MPVRARKTEAGVAREALARARPRRKCLPLLETEFTPISDVRGSAEYRRQLITTLLGKFFAAEEAAA